MDFETFTAVATPQRPIQGFRRLGISEDRGKCISPDEVNIT